MRLFDKIKNIFQKMFQKQLQLTEGEKIKEKVTVNSNNEELKSRVNLRGITHIFDRYKKIQHQIRDSQEQDDKYLGEFYNTLVKVCGENTEHSFEKLEELDKQLNKLNNRLLTFSQTARERGENAFHSKEYEEDIQEEYKSIIRQKRKIQETWDKCVKKMEAEYYENPEKFEKAKEILDMAVESNNSTKLDFAKKLGLEYAILSKVSNEGELSEEQVQNIELALGEKPEVGSISEFVEERKRRIEERLEEPDTLIGNDSLLSNEDEGKFAKVEGLIKNDIADEEVKSIFLKTKEKAEEALPNKVPYDYVNRLYEIKNVVFELDEGQNNQSQDENRSNEMEK